MRWSATPSKHPRRWLGEQPAHPVAGADGACALPARCVASPAVDVDQVAAELYALTAEEFTAARNARAKEAKAAGDKQAALQIAALRKPTTVAWLANLLARQRPDEIGALLELGAALREATATLRGPALRELSGQRHRLVYALVQQAKALAGATGKRITEDVARGLEETLTVALADPEAARLLARSRLTEGLAAGGFTGAAPPATDAARPDPEGLAERRTSGTVAPQVQKPIAEEGGSARHVRRTQRDWIERDRIERDRIERERARLGRELRNASERAKLAGAAEGETSVAFDEAQRALTRAELALAELRAEIARAEETRSQAQQDSDRAQQAFEKAAREARLAAERVAALQSRLDAL